MKYAKILGLLAVAAAALMAFAGTASATVLTSPSGTVWGTGENDVLKAESENGHVTLDSEGAPTAFSIKCGSSVEGKLTQHGAGVTAKGTITKLSFVNCTENITVNVIKAGTLEVHSTGGGNGTVTSSGAEIEAIIHPLGSIKCIYKTAETDVGEITGSTKTSATATLDIKSLTITRSGGSVFCGTGGFWNGSYTVTSPMTLDVS